MTDAAAELPFHFYYRQSDRPQAQSHQGNAVDFIILPGNPGCMQFYKPFADCLFEKCDRSASVYVISHLGHSTTSHAKAEIDEDDRRSVQSQSDWSGDDLSIVDLQVLQKLTFLRSHVNPESTLILIGHSVGSYILLKMLPHIDRRRIGKAIFLFPTIYRIADTPNGRWQRPFYTRHMWIPLLFANLVLRMPRCLLTPLIGMYMRWEGTSSEYIHQMTKGVLEMGDSSVLKAMLTMGECEMLQINDFSANSRQTILDFNDKCSFYYGASDKWAPEEWVRYFSEQFPQAHVHRCDPDIKHAFVLSSFEEVADMVLECSSDILLS
ncbi:lipid droplet-associated hydrolase-like [Corticium candelabrum]|uniref:lipid droplet-associated hydrolase-like n=1 Tax=Corticium candelabrum TaxID=121492 RepID=UPI002E253E99|nr:lipid droplet-associated hydrolase-like [Corticium candelabrum]